MESNSVHLRFGGDDVVKTIPAESKTFVSGDARLLRGVTPKDTWIIESHVDGERELALIKKWIDEDWDRQNTENLGALVLVRQ